jgi:Mn2+/Fe2+ NRAMP family transporter
VRHYNKREKTANWLFKVAEYVAIALGINALLPNSPITIGNALIGIFLLLILLVSALWITPEKEE